MVVRISWRMLVENRIPCYINTCYIARAEQMSSVPHFFLFLLLLTPAQITQEAWVLLTMLIYLFVFFMQID